MTVEEYAKFVIDNMGRASLSNAMNIAEKIDNPNFYALCDFVKSVDKYVGNPDVINRLGQIKAYKIVIASDNCLRRYNSDIKYNKRMIIDNYIMDIWRAFNDR